MNQLAPAFPSELLCRVVDLPRSDYYYGATGCDATTLQAQIRQVTVTHQAATAQAPTSQPTKLEVVQATASSSAPQNQPASAFDQSWYCWRSTERDVQCAWLDATFDSPKTLVSLTFYGTNIWEARVVFENGSTQKIALKNFEEPQWIELQPIVTSHFRIIVDRV